MSTPSRQPKRDAGVIAAATALWMARLYREKRLFDYFEAKAAQKASGGRAVIGTPEGAAASRRAVALKKEFGWTGIEDEFERERIFAAATVFNSRKEMMAEAQRSKGRTRLAKAFDELPDNVAYEQEVAWVRAHPLVFTALDRVMREEEYKPPQLTVRDLLGRSNGPAPSKGAATQLRFALADPIGWNKRLMDGGKKKAAEGSGGKTPEGDSEVVVDDMSDIRQMVASIGKMQRQPDA